MMDVSGTGLECGTHAPALAALMSPALFYAGLGAAAIPILIHLLNKRRFRKIRWAATDFLQEAQRQNRRRLRVEEFILLLLRCLAMLLLGLTLARWFLRPEALAAVLGTAARTERIVLLDNSFSMGLHTSAAGSANRGTDNGDSGRGGPGPGTVFGQAVTAVHRLVQWLHDESPADPLTIILTSRPDRPLRTEPTVGDVDLPALRAELEALGPSSRGGNMPAALRIARDLLERRDSTINAAVYVVSDFQQIDWAPSLSDSAGDVPAPGMARQSESGHEKPLASHTRPGASPQGGGSAAAALSGWAGQERSLRILLVDVGLDTARNLCVSAIEPQQSQVVRGVGARYVARVTNFGDAPSPQTSLRVYVGEAAQPPVPIAPIDPRRTVEVPLDVTFLNDGSETLSVELEPDALPVDGTRACAVPVARALRVLVVNGEPSSDAYTDEAFLLTVALRPEGPQFSGNDVTVVDENEFDETDLSSFHAVVLANVYRITEDAAARLSEYVGAGGGLILFLGDQIDADLYNRLLYREGRGLLPAKLGEAAAMPADQPGVPWGEADATHPVARRFHETGVSWFDGVVAWQYFRCEVSGGTAATTATTTSAHSIESHPASGAGDRPTPGPPRVLLALADADRSPVLVEGSLGQGRVILAATSADKEWTNLPDHPVYVILVQELVQYVARAGGGGGQQLVGQPIALPLDPQRYQPGAALRTPMYPDEPAVTIEALPDASTGAPMIAWPQTDRPGVYRFDLTETTGGQVIEHVAVNVDPGESDLRRADHAMLRESLAGLPIEYVHGDKLVGEPDTHAQRELWPVVLIALVGVLMSEQFLAWWFGSGRRWGALRRGSR